MNKIQNEKWLNALPEEAVSVAEEINIEIAKVIAERIKKIGTLTPSDVKKLTNAIEYLGADFQKITKLIAKYSDKGQMAVVDTLKSAADANDEFANTFYSAKGIAAYTQRNDPYLNALVEGLARQTAAEFDNLSNTLAYKIDDKVLTLRQMYTRTVDKAIYEAQSGTIDYYTAMRKSIRQLSDNMRILKWESGTVRRLDSHIRQNLLDGIKQLNQQMLDYHGEKFGSDGVELSAHAISAPDHAPIQGRQFSNEQFYRMQNQMPFEDVNGNQYPAMPRRIGEWNCKHFAFPIVLGVSEPAYSEEQLKDFLKNSEEKYDLTQEQRKMENKLRRLKNERLIASAAGDELEAKRLQRKINEQQTAYREFSEEHGLYYDRKRATVDGYRRISIKGLQNLENRDILKKKIAKGEITLTLNPEKQNAHMFSHKDYVNGRSYVTIPFEELQNIINKHHATGRITISKSGQIKETIFIDKIIGFDVDLDGNEFKTNGLKIHYSKSRTHAVPHRKKVLND